jgi:hypothetical protein
MTWYNGTCGIMAMGLIYELTLWSMCVGGGGFGSNGFVIKTQPFPKDGHYRKGIINGVGHPRLNLVESLVLCTVCYAMVGAPTLYYRSLRTASTSLRRDNILCRPYY